jgi:sensor histidine kinase YesM
MSQEPDNKHSLPIAQKYVYLTALTLSLLMIFQSNVMVDGQWRLNLNKVIVFAFNYLVWAASVPFIYSLVQSIDWQSQWKLKLLRWLGAGLLICLVQLILSNLLYYSTILSFDKLSVADPISHFLAFLPSAFLSRVIDLIVIVLLLKGLDTNRNLNNQKIALAELENELTNSKLEALKMQLNPHFLFNSLHAIHSLIGYEDDKARTMVLKIGNLLRRILELSNQQTIALSDELSYLKDYLDIEQERFHDRLKIEYDVDDKLLSVAVPSLILQPLAENALKHGISLLEGQGEIVISINKTDEDKLLIKMKNSVGDDSYASPKSTGIGLDNLKKRLEQLYGNDYSLKTNRGNSIFEVIIALPIIDDAH